MEMKKDKRADELGRREFLKTGAMMGTGLALGSALTRAAGAQEPESRPASTEAGHDFPHKAGLMGAEGDIAMDGTEPLNPMDYLTAFNQCQFDRHRDWYKETPLPKGGLLREYEIFAYEREIEIAPGIFFPAWTYNGQVPGPTIRATEGDHVRIRFVNESQHHAHTMHFHGFHHADMDGVFEIVTPGQEFIYEFIAGPAGLHLYHCHTVPLKRHIHKGLYGVFIVDPPEPRAPARELVMMMNGFDTNFDSENEIYAVNSVAFHFMKHPIPAKVGELVRIYLVNILEFDLVNSLHVHANFFDVYRTGTRTTSDGFTDTVALVAGERAVLEMRFRHPGRIMFHAHQSEFAELGWMGLFEVEDAT